MTVVLIVVGLLALLALIKAIHVVPQASAAVVERFGRYARTLDAGLHLVVPFIESVRNRIDLREQVVPFPPQPVITHERLVVNVDTVIYYRVTDPRAATYEVASYIQAIEQLTVTTLRKAVGDMDLERTLTSREAISTVLREVLAGASGTWGILVNRVELKSIEPPASIQESIEKHLGADRDKRAAILIAEGNRQSAILTAEGARRAALMEAETQRDVAAILATPGNAPTPTAPASPVLVPRQLGHEPLRKEDPRRIGRYHLTARLGQGGMGTVFLGRSPGERLVAVKVIRSEHVANADFRQRFAREIQSARRVGGFHTAAVVDSDATSERPWLVTEYIAGPSLHDVLKQYGAMPPRTLHTLALGIAEALEGIHSCDIIHRDLKPSNIIISATGPRVIDFGIARAFDSTTLTRTNARLGTDGFMAPEQSEGSGSTSASDLYAYGIVLCHAAGAAPFPVGQTRDSALELLPSTLAPVVARCLSRDPAQRPTCTEVLEQLAQVHQKSDDWLPPPVRTMVDFHNAPTV
ncbi:SPFH domain-containing protein [Streptomyces sp. ME02-7008A-1]|nr:SPFH domain-containing protein [Streptomyces sp. ME02-7008A-1]MDX3302967.1 SPFH domain-containing protein [Streptomyces sp. ME02-7008A]WSI21874.1 SPFH domain-containing protein [[Kitasatospora] papulosa]